MILTVIWEDQRGVLAKGFGPHELLVSCLADDLQPDGAALQRYEVEASVESTPMKGNGKVLRTLKSDLARLRRRGPVVAVLDRDRILDYWQPGQRPAACLTAIRRAIFADAPGDYELVLLSENVETLMQACCDATSTTMPLGKPSPDERDNILGRAAWAHAAVRTQVRAAVPSFERLVSKVREQVRAALE